MDTEIVAIYTAPSAGAPMQMQYQANAIAGEGLEGDRYCTATGSFNRNQPGRRQVTLMNSIFFEGSPFIYADSRRNIFTLGVELMWLIDREFAVGDAVFRGIKYCDPCDRPNKLSRTGNVASFKKYFEDRGGLVAEIIKGGVIKVGSQIITPTKKY